jgi:lactoylglutathione lyase
MTLVVDIHAHLLDEHALEVAGPHGAASGFGARPSIPPSGSRFAEINALMLDPGRQVAAMDERGVDVHLVSAILAVTPTGWADAQTALELNRRYNDRIAEAVRDHPGRLVGSCTLPLQDLDLALAELDRAHGQLGLGVIQLPANIGGVSLGEPPLRPLWEEIARRDLVVFIHPDGCATPGFSATRCGTRSGSRSRRRGSSPRSSIRACSKRSRPAHRVLPRRRYLRRLYYDTCVYAVGIVVMSHRVTPHHVGLTVSDLERARAFYERTLGLELQLAFELPGGARGAMLHSSDGARVELFEIAEPAAGVSGVDPREAMRTLGFGHVAFELDDLDAGYETVMAAGAGEVWPPRPSPEPGRRMAFVHDLDGNLVELIGPPE